MKLEDIIWDVRHILMALSETTTVLDGDIIEKLNSYRMAYINKFWQKNHYILEDWFQPLGTLIASDWQALPLPLITLVPGKEYKIMSGNVTVTLPVASAPISPGTIEEGVAYIVTNGTALYPNDGGGVSYTVGQYFIGLAGHTGFAPNIGGTVGEVIPTPTVLSTYTSFIYNFGLYPEQGPGLYIYTFNGTVYPTNPVEIAKYPTNALYPQSWVIGGQCNAPRTIQLANDIQYRIYKDVLGSVMYPIGYRQLLMMIEFADERNSKFDFYSFKENKLFTYPKNNITGSAIFEEPTEIRSRTMEVVTEIQNMTLVNGLRYKVLTGSIMYPIGETVYNAGSYFTAGVANEWDPGSESSVGKVDSIPIPDVGHEDVYPIDVEGARECILEMLTKDYKIRMGSISDTVQDDQDQFKVLTSRS